MAMFARVEDVIARYDGTLPLDQLPGKSARNQAALPSRSWPSMMTHPGG